jgi:transposase
MRVAQERCCGLDVQQKTVVTCVLLRGPDGAAQRRVRSFGTMTADLLALSDWLGGYEVAQIAMESTGVYWRPVFNILEDEARTITLVNPQHMRAVPGRKTDVKDSEWLADLLRHGLIQPSVIPPAPTRERERRMRRCKSPGHAQRFLAAYGPIAAHFRPCRHHHTATDYRQTRSERFATWRAVTGTPALA